MDKDTTYIAYKNAHGVTGSFRSISRWSRRIVGLLLVVFFLTGCRSGQRLFPNMNMNPLARIPAPSTGTLRFPGSGTAPLNPPPSQINVNPSATAADGTPKSGVFFQSNVGPYTSGQSNTSSANTSSGQPLNSIPGRSNPLSASALGGPGSNSPRSSSVAPVSNNLTAFNNGASTSVGFDPFRTNSNPNWANTAMNGAFANGQAASNTPNLVATSGTGPDANRPGWYTGDSSASPSGNGTGFFQAKAPDPQNQNLAIGNGRLMQQMSNSFNSFFNRQPANLGGFQTNAPINSTNGFVPGQAYPVAPVQYYQQRNGQFGQPAAGGQGPVYQGQNQFAQPGRLQGQGGGLVSAPQYQVLGENSTSLMAENQARSGVRQNNSAGGSGYSAGGNPVGGNVYPAGRPLIAEASTQNSGINSQWVPVTARR